jgi:hypothetical protein
MLASISPRQCNVPIREGLKGQPGRLTPFGDRRLDIRGQEGQWAEAAQIAVVGTVGAQPARLPSQVVTSLVGST